MSESVVDSKSKKSLFNCMQFTPKTSTNWFHGICTSENQLDRFYRCAHGGKYLFKEN